MNRVGKLHPDFGLGWINYGARFYDPAIGRFIGVDPISDQFPHVSTYNYAENEPVGSIDLWGLQKVNVNDIRNAQGQITSRNVTVSVNMKVLNQSSKDNFMFRSSMGKAEAGASRSFKTSFLSRVLDSPEKGLTDNKVRVNVNFDLNIQELNSLDKVSDSDFVGVVVDGVKQSGGSDGTIGRGEFESNLSIFDASSLSGSSGAELILHELGHNLALEFSGSDPKHTSDGSGLMGANMNGSKSVSKSALFNLYKLAISVTGANSEKTHNNSVDRINKFVKDNSN